MEVDVVGIKNDLIASYNLLYVLKISTNSIGYHMWQMSHCAVLKVQM